MLLIVRNSGRFLLQKTHKCNVHVSSCGEGFRPLMLCSTTKVGQEVLWKASTTAVSSSSWLQSLYQDRVHIADTHLVNTAFLRDVKSQKCKKTGSQLSGNPTPVELVLRLKQGSLPNWGSSSALGAPNQWCMSTDKLTETSAKVSTHTRFCDKDSIRESPIAVSYNNQNTRIRPTDTLGIHVQFVEDSKLEKEHRFIYGGNGGEGGVGGGKPPGKGGDSHTVSCDGSGGSKEGGTPEDRNGPTVTQLKDLEFYIQDKMPKFFHEPHQYAIYVPDIEFHNNIAQKPYKTKGLLPYVWALTKLRFFSHMNYVKVQMRILKTTIDEDMGIVQVRWQVYGMPQTIAVKFWKVFRDNNEVVIDGFSTLSVNKDGKIWKHVADNVMPDQERKRRRMTFVERLRERWRLRPVTGLNATAKK